MDTPITEAIKLAGGATRMARALGVTPTAVGFWRDGRRRLPVEHGAAIEAATGGRVRRWDLWPHDWKRIWPELADSPDAPQVPGLQA